MKLNYDMFKSSSEQVLNSDFANWESKVTEIDREDVDRFLADLPQLPEYQIVYGIILFGTLEPNRVLPSVVGFLNSGTYAAACAVYNSIDRLESDAASTELADCIRNLEVSSDPALRELVQKLQTKFC